MGDGRVSRITDGEVNPSGLAANAEREGLEQQLVRVEANFLRLPLFALDNKHMRTMDGIRCAGTLRRGGQSYAFTYVVTRNARTMYAGPLARSAHFALLSLATDRGFPIANPLVFSWRELCSRMTIQVSGKTVTALRDALIATKGLMIESHSALFSKADDKPLNSSDYGQVISLYDELEFFGAERPDGSRVDVNAVWFSRWYLDNLNALYSAPINFDLWRSLNDKSLIASRLYEFLLYKFHGGREFLRFNYPTLVKFIPARTERYLSDAKKQLQPAFDSLIDVGILSAVQWLVSQGGEPQLLLRRGAILDSSAAPEAAYDVAEEDFVLNHVENVSLPESAIVQEFHRLWGHDNFRPSKPELLAARTLLDRFGQDRLTAMLPAVAKRIKLKWPDAKTFVAVNRYIDDVADEYMRRERFERRERDESASRERERAERAERANRQEALRAAWATLSPDEQAAIRDKVLSGQPTNLQKFPAIIERLCLEELSKKVA